MYVAAYMLVIILAAASLSVSVSCTSVILYVTQPLGQGDDINVNITTDDNGTVYIQISGVTIYNYTRTTLTISWLNITHIAVVYSGVYQHSPSELYIMRVEIYNGSYVNASPVYDVVFNATNATGADSVLYMSRYFDVDGFSNITYVVYVFDNGTWTMVYEGCMPVPPGRMFAEYYAMEYMSYLAVLIPVAILFGLAGRGNIRDIGVGLIAYGVFLMALPFMGIYPPHMNALIVVSILGGIILLIFTK